MSDAKAQAHPDPQPQSDQPTAGLQIRLRLWPGAALLAVMWLVRTWAVTGDPAPQKFFFGLVIVPLAVLVGIVLWWLLASRLPWSDRGLVVGIFAAAVAGTLLLIDPSLQGPALALSRRRLWLAPGWDGCCFPSGFTGRPAGRSCCCS